MKRLFIMITLAAAALQLSAQSYSIKGTAEGTVDGDTIYLSRNQGYFLIPVDSTIVKDGQFVFTGEIEGCTHRYIQAKHNGSTRLTSLASVILEPADITVKMYLAEKKQDSEVVGGPNHALNVVYHQISRKHNGAITADFETYYYKKGTEEEQRLAKARVDSVMEVIHEEERQFVIEHLPMPICDLWLGSGYSNWDDAQKKEVMAAFASHNMTTANYQHLVKEELANAKTAVGTTYTDFSMEDPDGKMVKLSDFVSKAKYTLIDFWASWCGPCRAEMPNVVKAYEECHSKGFEVVGVSLDNKKDAWVKAIGDLNMPWPQMSDLKAWKCEGAAIYNVKAIPANVLVDQNGKILAKNLRGDKLIKKIHELCD